ncbi:MFS transporter [Streptomyces sp. NA02950]|uniref:MFS transporter n=1 Tax=Streptomyces sp. NA02950 TaxID=2742137 RepID=UPI0015924F4A|nr:MFS transporter [Streptomyces sp. NA02950]QKV90704.1 MFS transporter [Streptomyces sp. NA02950]
MSTEHAPTAATRHIGLDPVRAAPASYGEVLALPSIRALYGVAFAARLPLTATSVVLTLHVAVGHGRGFAVAGMVGGAFAGGMAVGAPGLGRMVDHFGLRPVLALCGCADAVFWGVGPFLDPRWLALAAIAAGALTLPAFSVVRQALGAMTTPAHRRPAFALDAMSAEVSYIVGPALGSAAALTLPTTVAMWLVGGGFLVTTLALWLLDPPTRDLSGPGGTAAAPRVRSWLGRPMVAALAGAAAAILLQSATELSVVATLTGRGETGWFALTNAVWCAASLVGGFLYGAAARPLPLPVLLGLFAAGPVPVALGGPWWLMTLLLMPAGFFCAPALAAAAERVGRLAPDAARGTATGLHSSAIMAGGAVAGPLTGVLIETASPAVAILAAAGACALVAALASIADRGPTGPVGRRPHR